jgi:hypothetical protein
MILKKLSIMFKFKIIQEPIFKKCLFFNQTYLFYFKIMNGYFKTWILNKIYSLLIKISIIWIKNKWMLFKSHNNNFNN